MASNRSLRRWQEGDPPPRRSAPANQGHGSGRRSRPRCSLAPRSGERLGDHERPADVPESSTTGSSTCHALSERHIGLACLPYRSMSLIRRCGSPGRRIPSCHRRRDRSRPSRPPRWFCPGTYFVRSKPMAADEPERRAFPSWSTGGRRDRPRRRAMRVLHERRGVRREEIGGEPGHVDVAVGPRSSCRACRPPPFRDASPGATPGQAETAAIHSTTMQRIGGRRGAGSPLVGVISDTHGLLRPEAVAALAASTRSSTPATSAAPRFSTRSAASRRSSRCAATNDRDAWAAALPEIARLEIVRPASGSCTTSRSSPKIRRAPASASSSRPLTPPARRTPGRAPAPQSRKRRARRFSLPVRRGAASPGTGGPPGRDRRAGGRRPGPGITPHASTRP